MITGVEADGRATAGLLDRILECRAPEQTRRAEKRLFGRLRKANPAAQ